MEKINAQKPAENYGLWGLKILAGVLVLGILGIHYVMNHLVAPGGLLTYNDILGYYQKPIVPIMEITFLIFVVVHALLGLRSILLDIRLGKIIRNGLDVCLFSLGIITIAYGIWVVIRVVQLGSS